MEKNRIALPLSSAHLLWQLHSLSGSGQRPCRQSWYCSFLQTPHLTYRDIFRVQSLPVFQLPPPWPQLVVLACMQSVFTGQLELSHEICQLSDHTTPLLNSLHSPHIFRNKARVINFLNGWPHFLSEFIFSFL